MSAKLLVENGVVVASSLVPKTMKELLLNRTRGVYSGTRTIQQKKIFLFEMHLERLASGLSNLSKKTFSVADVKQVVMPSLQLALSTCINSIETNSATIATTTNTNSRSNDEFKITILVSNSENETSATASENLGANNAVDTSGLASQQQHHGKMNVSVYVEPLPIRTPPIIVEMHKHSPRENPETKDSMWVAQRDELERNKPREVDEIVMFDNTPSGNHLVSEGLSSNFGVVLDDNEIVTAPPHTVLTGTVLTLAQRLCAQRGIAIQSSGVLMSSMARWKGAFVASTTRGLLPINELRVYFTAKPLILLFETTVLDEISVWVQQAMDRESTPIIE